MEMCSNGHEEIVYDKGKCPLCYQIEEIEALQKENESLQEELNDLNNFLTPELP